MSDRVVDSMQGLSGLIGETPYQASEGDSTSGESGGQRSDVNQSADNRTEGNTEDGRSTAAGNVNASNTGATGQEGVTNPASSGPGEITTQPDPRDAQIRQLTETINNQTRFIQTHAQQMAAREEAEFRRSLEDMEPEEREAAIERRELQQLRQRERAYQNQTQQQRQQTQQQAKNMVALMTAADYGLPPSSTQILRKATSVEDMQAMANDLVSRGYGTPQQQAQQVQQQGQPQQVQQGQQQRNAQGQFVPQQQQQEVNPAHLGGDSGGSSDVTPEVEYGSGNLMDYIQGTQWTVYQPSE